MKEWLPIAMPWESRDRLGKEALSSVRKRVQFITAVRTTGNLRGVATFLRTLNCAKVGKAHYLSDFMRFGFCFRSLRSLLRPKACLLAMRSSREMKCTGTPKKVLAARGVSS
jgi:hypothetical protein